MSNKIWHKTLYKRKIWKDLPLYKKIRYYLQPFANSHSMHLYIDDDFSLAAEHLCEIWFQPLPFPTILKVVQSFALILTALIPVIYPIVLLLWTFAEIQYILTSHFGIQLPKTCDLLEFSTEVITFKVTNDAHAMFLSLYLERWRLIATAITSSIDYFRMACFLLLGLGE